MNAGTAYLILCAFAAAMVFGVADPLITEVGDSLSGSTAMFVQAIGR